MKIKQHIGVLLAISIASSPVLTSAVSDSDNTTVNASIASVISMTSPNPGTISITPTTSAVVSSTSQTVTVSTNNGTGYILTLVGFDAIANMMGPASSVIEPHEGTFASPTPLATGTWGYRVVGAGGFGASAYSGESNNTSSSSTWAGVPGSNFGAQDEADIIKTTSGAATNDITTIWYGLKIDSSYTSGSYSNSDVLLTATTNP